MKLASFCFAAALLSTNVFAQAKPNDLAATPVTTHAQTTTQSAQAPASKKLTHHAHKTHKKLKSSAAVAKKKMHTASASMKARNANRSAVR